jgi:hypothetical protein
MLMSCAFWSAHAGGSHFKRVWRCTQLKKGLLGTEVVWLGCELAGDWGDRDLQGALANFWGNGRRVALCAFGHMHHNLNDGSGGTREAVKVC